MVLPLENSRTWSTMESSSQPSSPWGSSPPCGTLTTGRRKAGGWKPTGASPPSQPTTGNSPRTPAFGRRPASLPALQCLQKLRVLRGWTKNWTQPNWIDWDGSRRSTWFTTIALIWRGFHRDYQRNVYDASSCVHGNLIPIWSQWLYGTYKHSNNLWVFSRIFFYAY